VAREVVLDHQELMVTNPRRTMTQTMVVLHLSRMPLVLPRENNQD
jgi:hypothetical protein